MGCGGRAGEQADSWLSALAPLLQRSGSGCASLLNKTLRACRLQVASKGTEVASLQARLQQEEQHVAELTAQLESKRAQVERLEEEVRGQGARRHAEVERQVAV